MGGWRLSRYKINCMVHRAYRRKFLWKISNQDVSIIKLYSGLQRSQGIRYISYNVIFLSKYYKVKLFILLDRLLQLLCQNEMTLSISMEWDGSWVESNCLSSVGEVHVVIRIINGRGYTSTPSLSKDQVIVQIVSHQEGKRVLVFLNAELDRGLLGNKTSGLISKSDRDGVGRIGRDLESFNERFANEITTGTIIHKDWTMVA